MTGFDAAERAAILEEWQRRRAAWKTSDKHPVGCLMMLGGVLLMFVVPLVLKSVVPPVKRPIFLAAGLLVAVVGFVVMQIRVVPYDVKQLIEESAATLQRGDADLPSRRRAAVVLLFHYTDVRGPTESNNFSAGEMRGRLAGQALDYVTSVERLLRAEKLCGAVFLPQDPV